MSISQNTALFALIGTFYGGNGKTNFALPDMRGRVAMHQGGGPGLTQYVIGEQPGVENVSLITTEIPSHNHSAGCVDALGDDFTGAGNVPAQDAAGNNVYTTTGGSVMNAQAIGPAGSGFPHNNMQPSLAVNYCIALQGIFPARN